MLEQVLRTKPLSGHDHGDLGSLRRCLGPIDLTLLGIGAIIGTGIFVLTGKAAANLAGPAVVISFILAGLACAFAALAYAELAASVGGCGSAYGYSYAAFGELLAWIIGWDLLLEYGVAVAAVANGWSAYCQALLARFGWGLPEALSRGPEAGGIINLPATLVVLVLMALLVAGVRESARINAVAVVIKLATIAVFIAVAGVHVEPGNWTDFMPYGWYGTGEDGNPIGILAGASLVFFAYVGFDAVSTAAEEARDPARDLPIGILASLIFCTLIYIAVSGLLTGIVPYQQLDVDSPVAFGLTQVGMQSASLIVGIGALAGLTTVMLVLYYGLTRIVFAMARDGLLPGSLANVHPRTQTPVTVIVASGLVMATAAGAIPLSKLAELVNIGTLFAFVLVCIGVLVLRFTEPNHPRPFKTPWGPVIPVLGALSCAALMAFLPSATWWRFGLWLACGLVLYFVYGMHHSRLAKTARGA